jgi:hypothetical protein
VQFSWAGEPYKKRAVAVQTGCKWQENDRTVIPALYLLTEVTLSYLVVVITTNRQLPAIQSISYGVTTDMVHFRYIDVPCRAMAQVASCQSVFENRPVNVRFVGAKVALGRTRLYPVMTHINTVTSHQR